MAIDAGTLEIKMLMGLARLQQDVTQAVGIVGKGMAGIESAARVATAALGALGATLSVGFFATLIKGSIDAMDHLNDLSKTTRIAAEDLAGLRFAAQQSGTDLEATASAINKLAINMGKNGEQFRALGITAKDPIEAFKQLADVTNAMNDPQQRAAVLAQALGKSWERVAPLLAEGSAKIGEMVEKGKALSGITNENVRLADELKDKWGELVGSGGALNATVGSMLPLLNQLVADLIKLKGDGAGGGFSGMAEILRGIILLGGNVAFVLRGIGIELGGLYAQQAALLNGDFKRFVEIGREMRADADANRKAFDLWEAGIISVGTAAKAATPSLDAMDQVSRRQAQDASAAGRAFLEGEKAKREAEAAARKAAADEKRLQEQRIRDWVKYIDEQTAEYERGLKEQEKLTDAFWKEKKRLQDLDDKGWVAKIDADIEAYERGLKTMAGMDKSQAEIRTKMWEDLSTVAGDFFADLVMHGKSAFENLRKWVKQLLAEMIALFAKRWVLNMVAGGSVLGSAGQALAGGTGSDSIAGSVLNWGSTAIGLTGAGGAASMFVGGMTGAIPAAAIGAEAVAAGVGTTSFAAGAGSALSGVYTALAAIPVWGWIAMAVIAIGAWIAGSKAGGPKVGGSFFQGGAVPGTDNGRFFTPSQGDPMMRELVTATSNGYLDAITRLGGTAGAFNFGLGFDHDPSGSAMSRVSSGVYGPDGRLLYGRRDVEMDDKEVPAALGLESQRMVIAALQASDLGPELDAFFDTITDIASLTSEQINAILIAAKELKDVVDALAAWDIGLTVEGLRSMAREGETLTQVFNAVSQGFSTYRSLFFTEEENRTFGLDRMTKEFERMGLTMPTTREAFRALVEGIDKTTESGARLWRWLIEMAPAFADLVPALDGVTDAVDDISDAAVAAVVLIDRALDQNVHPEDRINAWYAAKPARARIADHLDGLLSGDSSPLDPMGKFRAAEESYNRILGLAQGGDADAMMKLPGVHQTMLDLARSIWGSSSPFVELFERSFNEVAGVGEVADYNERMLKMQTDSVQYQAQMADSLLDIRGLLTQISQKSGVATADSWAER